MITICLGTYGLIAGRNQLCGPFAAIVPGVSCPPPNQPATEASAVVVALAVAIIALLASLRYRTIRRWRARIDAGEIRPLPFIATLCSFVQAFTLFAAIILFLVLSSRQIGGPYVTGSLRLWPIQLTTGLLIITALCAAFWRRGRLINKAMRKWNIVLESGSGAASPRVHAAAPRDLHPSGDDGAGVPSSPDSSGYVTQPADSSVYGPAPESPQDDRPPAGVRDGFYGDGPQQGTRSPADDRGSLYSSGPEHGTKSMADEPGGFYSSDPFGTRSE